MPIIYRPDAVGDWLASYLTDQSRRDAIRHEEELAERKKKQKTTAVVGGALGGAALAGFAAPALGLAGSAATPGTLVGSGLPYGAGALAVPGTAATTGVLGAGGVTGLTGYLTGAQLGSQLGQQFADEDYAGAIGTAAGAAQSIQKARENQAVYGFQPSREGRQSLADLAEKAGTTIDQLEQKARQTGTTVAEQLGLSQEQARSLAIQEDYLGAAARRFGDDDARSLRLGIESDLDSIGGYESAPDDGAISEAQSGGPGSLESIDADEVAYRRSGGNDGATYSENMGSLQSVQDRLRAGRRGARRRKPPTVTDHLGKEHALGSSWESDGVIYRSALDAKGNPQIEKVAGEYKQTPEWVKLPPGPERDQAKADDFALRTHVDPNGQTWIRKENGVWELEKDAGAEAAPGWVAMPEGPQRETARDKWAKDQLFQVDGRQFRRTKDGLIPVAEPGKETDIPKLLLDHQAKTMDPIKFTVRPIEDVAKDYEKVLEQTARIQKSIAAEQAAEQAKRNVASPASYSVEQLVSVADGILATVESSGGMFVPADAVIETLRQFHARYQDKEEPPEIRERVDALKALLGE